MTTKRIVILSIVALLVVAGIWKLLGASLSNPWLDGEAEKVSRGDLSTPVTASGTIEANQFIEVKSKASGQVTKIYVVEGQMVNKNDLLVELDPIDEQRAVERTGAELERAEAALQQARTRVQEFEATLPLNTRTAAARIDEIKAQVEDARVNFEKTDKLFKQERPVATLQEWTIRKAAYDRLLATQKTIEFDYERSKVQERTTLVNAQQDVRLAEAALKAAKTQHSDAQERLKETKVYSRTAGMIYSVRVKRDEVIQSGKTSLTGGTPLLYIADTSKMVVVAQVDEADVGSVLRIAPDYAKPGSVRPPTDAEMSGIASADPEALPTTLPAIKSPLSGQRVQVTVEAYRNETFDGIIERILPEPKKLNNVVTFDVRIVLSGDEVKKLMGLQSDVEFTADRVEGVLRVKNEAIVAEGRETFVYVPVDKPGSKHRDEKKVPVRIGVTDGTYTEIRSGLKEGDEVWIKRPRKTDREREQEEAKS